LAKLFETFLALVGVEEGRFSHFVDTSICHFAKLLNTFFGWEIAELNCCWRWTEICFKKRERKAHGLAKKKL